MQSDAIKPIVFKRHLGYFDATMIVMGGMVGAGIFINPAFVAQTLLSEKLIILAWSIGGVIAFFGATIFSELGALMPLVGGQYAYLSRGIHPFAGFLNGWGLFWIIATGAIAFVSVMSAEYLVSLLGLNSAFVKPVALTLLWGISLVNYIGIEWGSRFQNLFMIAKLLALLMLIFAGLLLPVHHSTHDPTLSTAARDSIPFFSLMGMALVPVLFSYGGWQNCNNIAEEIKNPHRNMPLAILTGTIAVILIYTTVNLVYLRVLGVDGLASTTTPAADAMAQVIGPAGKKFISIAIILSAIGIANLIILASPRVYFPAVRDHLRLPKLGTLHEKHQTPALLIIAQAGWTTVLILLGTFSQLLSYVIFADWLFFGLSAWALFRFRKTLPDAHRPYRALGYPVVPAIFLLFALFIVANTFITQFLESFIGTLLLLSALPIYLLRKKR